MNKIVRSEVRLPEEIDMQVKKICFVGGESKNQFIVKAIKEKIEREEKNED